MTLEAMTDAELAAERDTAKARLDAIIAEHALRPTYWHDCGDFGRWATTGAFAMREGERMPTPQRKWCDEGQTGVQGLAKLLAMLAEPGEPTRMLPEVTTSQGAKVVHAESGARFSAEYAAPWMDCVWRPHGKNTDLDIYGVYRDDKLVAVVMPRRKE